MTDYDACAVIEDFDGQDHTDEDRIEAFQHLINTGTVWQLQGFYGRTALRLLNNGLCQPATRQ